MFLLIHPDIRDSHRLALLDQNTTKEVRLEARTLLGAVDRFLSGHRLSFPDLQGIGVVVGVGTFSTLRSAIVLANTWHFALRIPVVDLTVEEWANADRAIDKFRDAKNSAFILPTYSAEPNIGKKRE